MVGKPHLAVTLLKCDSSNQDEHKVNCQLAWIPSVLNGGGTSPHPTWMLSRGRILAGGLGRMRVKWLAMPENFYFDRAKQMR